MLDGKRVIEGLKSHYRSGEHHLARDFFEPCMASCETYSRAVGYFSSSSLVSWADVLPRVVSSENLRIRLLISPQLSTQDRQALSEVDSEAKRRRLLEKAGDAILLDALRLSRETGNISLRLRLMQWLVATRRLRLKFAFPCHLEEPGFYHEKIGIFTFPWGARLAFTGSANETASGHTFNYESIDVFRDWVSEDVERVERKAEQFDTMWSDEARGLDVIGLSETALGRVRDTAPQRWPESQHEPTSAVDARWRHQDEAIDHFLEEERGVLEMATGTGKTRTALRIANRLIADEQIDTVIIAADGVDLLNQWQLEILRFEGAVGSFSILRHYETHHETELFSLHPTESVLLASRFSLAAALRELSHEQASKTLLVHDEVHSLGSPGRRAALGGLSDAIRFRLGLSATPDREYDDEGNVFIQEHIGPVIFQFSLADAIRRGILAPFDYHPLEYQPTEEDGERIAQVYRKAAAREAAGEPMSQEEIWIDLARVHKTSSAKIPVFEEFLGQNPAILERCIIFVETRDYGERILEAVHRYRHDFHTYFAAEDSDVLNRFAKGDLECLLTCHRLSEGIDIHNLRSIVLFSSARSRLETIQRIGRSLRRDPDDPLKRANAVDFIRHATSGDENADTARAAWLSELSNCDVEPGI